MSSSDQNPGNDKSHFQSEACSSKGIAEQIHKVSQESTNDKCFWEQQPLKLIELHFEAKRESGKQIDRMSLYFKEDVFNQSSSSFSRKSFCRSSNWPPPPNLHVGDLTHGSSTPTTFWLSSREDSAPCHSFSKSFHDPVIQLCHHRKIVDDPVALHAERMCRNRLNFQV